MTKLSVVAQAPASRGDGRAFTGQSGTRLSRMLGFNNYEGLSKGVDLRSLLSAPLETQSSRPGNTFSRAAARASGKNLVREFARDPELVVVLACGLDVYACLTGRTKPLFQGQAFKLGPSQFVDIWCFPHPSASSSFWRKPENVQQANNFLKRLVKHYGIDMAR